MEFLHRLRQKPSGTRERIALVTALGTTLIVAIVWVSSLPARFTTLGSVPEGATQDASAQNGFGELIEEIQANMDTTAPQEEVVEVSPDPLVEGVTIEALNNLGTENEMSTSTVPSAETHAAAAQGSDGQDGKIASTSASDSETSSSEERIILIGTTTKKAQ